MQFWTAVTLFSKSGWEHGIHASLSCRFLLLLLNFSPFFHLMVKWFVVIFSRKQTSKSKRSLDADNWRIAEREGIKRDLVTSSKWAWDRSQPRGSTHFLRSCLVSLEMGMSFLIHRKGWRCPSHGSFQALKSEWEGRRRWKEFVFNSTTHHSFSWEYPFSHTVLLLPSVSGRPGREAMLPV